MSSGGPIRQGEIIPLFVSPGGFSGGFTNVSGLTQSGLTRSVTQLTNGTGGNITYNCDGTLSASAAANTVTCSGDSYSLNGSASGGGGGYTYSWASSPAGFTSSSANPSVSPTATTTYNLTVTDTNGCTAAASTVVTVNALPTPTATNSGPVCVGGTLALTASGGVGYRWTGPNSFTSSEQNPTVSASATLAMAGTYTVTATNASGCTAQATTLATVNALPSTSVITGTNSVQQLTSYTYSVGNTAGSTYGWTVPAGASFTGGTANSITVTFGSTSGNVSVIETNATGCIGTQQTLSVTVITCTAPSIVGGIHPATVTATVGDPVVLTLTNVAGSSLVYQWKSNNVNIAGAIFGSYTNSSVTASAAGN